MFLADQYLFFLHRVIALSRLPSAKAFQVSRWISLRQRASGVLFTIARCPLHSQTYVASFNPTTAIATPGAVNFL
jgi:hypothetical protein